MSFVITVCVPDAIVMASDSRQFISIRRQIPGGEEQRPVETVNSDYVYKTFLMEKKGIGISTFGDYLIGGISFESHLRKFEEEKNNGSHDVENICEKLMKFFHERFPDAKTNFHVAGYRKENGVSIPYIYSCQVQNNDITRMHSGNNGNSIAYGCSWGGQIDIMAALMNSAQAANADNAAKVKQVNTPIIWGAMSVQDAIDFAIYAVRTTIDTIRFQARPKNVGGPIDVLLLTPENATWIQRKHLRGSA